MNRTSFITAGILAGAFLLLGWGSTGHRFINSQAVVHLPQSMQAWTAESAFFGSHASDADSRKGSDPTEGPKHYIDLELYADYQHLTDDLDSLLAAVGSATVASNGTLPWATRTAYDSLVVQLRRGDWNKAKLTASDIGHYVGDGHQPLHNTDNYNGQLTGNGGIHSRYETQMINTYQAQLTVTPVQARYVDDVFAYCLAYSIAGNAYVDSIMAADDSARVASGWSGSGTPPAGYYEVLWAHTRSFTIAQMQRASAALADLWFSAAVDAGTISSSDDLGDGSIAPRWFNLGQNYPNPFNPTTTIRFQSPSEREARLTVHDLSGKTVATLLHDAVSEGEHEIRFNASDLSSGIYVYTLASGRWTQSKKMLLIR